MLTSGTQFISVVLAAGLSVAMPYSIEFPSITLDLHPTFSPAVVNNTMNHTTSFSNQTTSMTLAIHPTLSPSTTLSNNYTNSSLGACGPGIGSCPSGLCCRYDNHPCSDHLGSRLIKALVDTVTAVQTPATAAQTACPTSASAVSMLLSQATVSPTLRSVPLLHWTTVLVLPASSPMVSISLLLRPPCTAMLPRALRA